MRAYLREWRKKNKEKNKAYQAKWKASNPENARQCNIRKSRKYYHSKCRTDPEFMRAATAKSVQWANDNPERYRKNMLGVHHRRRARKLNTQTGPVDYDLLILESNGLCGICRQPIDHKAEWDHIIPLARGGSHTQDNLQLAHPSCNRKKNRKLPEEMAA